LVEVFANLQLVTFKTKIGCRVLLLSSILTCCKL